MIQEISKLSNLVPVNSEKTPVLHTNFDITRAERALNGKKIINCTTDEFGEKMLLIFSMVGLRPSNYPIGQEKENLKNYIFFKYGQKTLDELVLAFDLAISGELEISPSDVKVYDQFTINYLAAIMASYKKWLFNQAKNHEPNKNILLTENKKEMEENEWAEWLMEIKNYRLELIPIAAYERLNATGKINLNTEQKKAYMASAKNYYLSSFKDDVREMNRFIEELNTNKLSKVHNDGLIAYAKKLAVKDYLTSNVN